MTQDATSPSTSTPDAIAGGADITDRLKREIKKHRDLRGAMHIGVSEKLLADALDEIQRLRDLA